MLQFLSRNKRPLFLLLVLAATLTFFARDIHSTHTPTIFNRLFVALLTPPLRITAALRDGATFMWRRYISLVHTQRENELLRTQRDALLVENQLLQDQVRENQRLRELLDFRQRIPFRMIAAEIIGSDPTSWFKSFMIDKGAVDGVMHGAGVIAPEGVVGRIITVASTSAHVLLLIDVNSNIDAVVQRTRARGIVVGTGHDRCRLAYVLKTEPIEPGDRLLTSGLGGFFPGGILIGSVVSVSHDAGGFFHHIEVEPAVNLSKLRNVFVVVPEQGAPR
ncbi:MAG: rod shape-determining protein MreC [Desulfobacterota bacterium]|nr:rod shape-determining protein MreC [Thermodesulfobacteriota bacterium]